MKIENETIISGITATGRLTIGNYLGAIKNFIKLQEKNDLYIFVADLHALTIEIDSQKLSQNKKEIFALYLACGLDINKSTIFFQSDNSDHLLFTWITICNSNMGELQRMTQFKDKVLKISHESNGTQKISCGLFSYPSLMAADILLYNPTLVPVGIDQKQHLELVQKIAKRLNYKYQLNFIEPKPYFSKVGTKIMSLQDPSKKMSKSDLNQKASIYLLDDPEIAAKKIMSAVTDSENKIYYSEKKAGISNLLNIYAAFKNLTPKETETYFANKNYAQLKQELAKVVKEFLIKIQLKYQQVWDKVDEYALIGKNKAQLKSNPRLKQIYQKIGL